MAEHFPGHRRSVSEAEGVNDDALRSLEGELHDASNDGIPNHHASLVMDEAVARLGAQSSELDERPAAFSTYLSPEEREQRNKLLDLHYATNGATMWNGGDYRSPYEEEKIKEWVDRDDISPGSPIVDETTGWMSSGRETYGKYLVELRKLRSEQAKDPYVREQLRKVREAPDAETRRKLYLEAMSFSSNVSQQALEFINTRNARLFTSEQIAEASRNPEAMQQAITQSMIRNPEMVIQSLDSIEGSVTPEMIRGAFDTLVREGVYMAIQDGTVLARVLKYYPESDRAQVVESMFANDGHRREALDKLLGPSMDGVFDDDLRRDLARKAFSLGERVPENGILERGIGMGCWTMGEVEAKLIDRLKEDPDDNGVFAAETMSGLSPAVGARIHEARLAHMMSDGALATDWDLKDFSDEDAERILVKNIEQDPIDAIENLTEAIKTHLPPEALRELYLRYVTDSSVEYSRNVLETDALTDDEKRQYMERLAQETPGKFLKAMRWGRQTVELFVGKNELKEEIRQAFYRASPGDVVEILDGFLDDFDDDELRALIVKCMSDGSIQFIEKIHGSVDNQMKTALSVGDQVNDRLRSLFTDEELEQIIDSGVMALGDKEEPFDLDTSIIAIEEMFGADKAREVFDKIRHARPADAAQDMIKCAYLYSPDEIEDYIRELAQSRKGSEVLLLNMGLGRYVESNVVHEVISTMLDGSMDGQIMMGSPSFEACMTHEEAAQIMAGIAVRNPALVLFDKAKFRRFGIEIDANVVIDTALADEAAMTVMGGYLQETLTRVKKTQNVNLKKRLTRDAIKAYKSAAALNQSGRADDFRSLRARAGIDGVKDRGALESYLVLTEFENDANTDDINSFDDLNRATLVATAHVMGITTVSDEQVGRLVAKMEGSNSLAVYAEGMRQSSQHRQVMQTMMQSMMDGDESYLAWRFGDNRDLGSLQQDGLLPRSLTLEQFAVWQQETSSSSEDAFTLEAREAANEISEVLRSSGAELPSLDEGATGEIAQQISAFGSEVADVHRQMQALRALPDQSMVQQQMSELQDRAKWLDEQRQRLQIQGDMAVLASLAPESITSGAVVRYDGKKGAPLVNVLRRFGKNLGPGREHIVDRVQTVLDSYRDQTGEMKKIFVRDTADPRLTIEIGDSPVESCQNYRDGIYKECLLGYTEPNTKVLVLSGEGGRPIARSIMRLLEDGQGQSALHMETVYSAQASSAVVKAIQLHAIAKAEAMGVPVYASTRSQNEQGQIVASVSVSGVQRDSAPGVALSSNGGRAPRVYVDSVGDSKAHGVYKVDKLMRLSRA